MTLMVQGSGRQKVLRFHIGTKRQFEFGCKYCTGALYYANCRWRALAVDLLSAHTPTSAAAMHEAFDERNWLSTQHTTGALTTAVSYSAV